MKFWIVDTSTPALKLKAVEISREIYKLSRPFPDPGDITLFAVSWVFSDDGNSCALRFPEKGDVNAIGKIIQSDMPIDDRRDTDKIETLLYANETETRKSAFRKHAIKANRPELVDLLPDKTKLKSQAWIYANGWTNPALL